MILVSSRIIYHMRNIKFSIKTKFFIIILIPALILIAVIYLDYIPGRGTRVTINGESKGLIAGRDFNNALLDIWLGEEPADKGLKKAMLGG